MRRTTAWLLSIILAAITGALLSGTVEVLTAPIPTPPRSIERSSAVVWAFYDAVNMVLQTGETASLDALLAKEMVDHDPAPGLPPTGAGLIRHLLSLHATHPGLTLVVDEVFATGAFATAQVHVAGSAPGAFLGLSVGAEGVGWGAFDQFRVVAGRIVEHWGSLTPPTFLEPLQQASVVNWFAARELITLERLTVPVGSRPTRLDAAVARFLYLDVGSLTVAIDPHSAAPGLVIAAAATAPAGRPTPLAPGSRVTLMPGDLLAFPKLSSYEIVNPAGVAAEAVVVVVSRAPTNPSGATARSDPAYSLDGQAAPDALIRAAVPLIGPFGAELPTMEAAVGVGRATLAPGGTLLLAAAAGPMLLAVEAGTLEIAVADGTAWMRRGATGESAMVTEGSFAAGDGVLVRPGSAIALHNPGREPAAILLVTILPEELPS